MLKLTDTVNQIPLVGTKYSQLLAKLGIITIKDMLCYFPHRHIDTSRVSSISQLDTFEKQTISCTVESIKGFRTKYGKFITQAEVTDESGSIAVIWFNQPFLTKTIRPGSKLLLYGKLTQKKGKSQLYSPEYEVLTGKSHTHLGIIKPEYSTTEGVSNKWLRSRIKFLLSKYPLLIKGLKGSIPNLIVKSYDLINFQDAVKHIHFPPNQKLLSDAKHRLAFGELFAIQLKLMKRMKKRKGLKAPSISSHNASIDKFLKSLEFDLTDAQLKAITEITADFNNNYPGNRLLQGDVGCGKTVVVTAAAIPVIKSGFQIALLAPTAILAKQHYETLTGLLKNTRFSIKLITGAVKNDKKYSKSSNIIIGTHALLHRYENLFENLGFIIIDEQHRFGVKQREALTVQTQHMKDKLTPHKLTMTATPIPRSIALSLFGDIDISIIDQMPKGRIPTKTHLVPHEKRQNAYSWIGEKAKKSQVFWIFPLIEESDKLQIKAVLTEYENLQTNIFPDLRIDVLHGKLPEQEKIDKILKMRQKKTDILMSTSVIEVGMDIPDANIIVIEGAERFGLAQLHQLRGRVGRRANQISWCFLFTSDHVPSETHKRLQYFAKVDNGLTVAKFDLQNRGPGEVYGTKQSGIPDLKIANFEDIKMIKQTREAAQEYLT